MKYEAMRSSAFAFLRGTCHLFYERLPPSRIFARAPAAWLCGDLHLQNFGSYKGDNRLVYFDINDFDEALLAPCTLDLVRFMVSVLVAAGTLRLTDAQARTLAKRFLEAYVAAIELGKARWIDRDGATGLIAALLNGLRSRTRKAHLNKRTRVLNGRRKLRVDGEYALPASPVQRRVVTQFMRRFARSQPERKFFRVLDVARRIAGSGSLGVEHYVVLIEGKGSPDGNYLLDLKQALRSSVRKRAAHKQPRWQSEAHRIVELQRRIQAVSMAFLTPVKIAGQAFVMRGLQPSEDRVALAAVHDWTQLEALMADMGKLVAWGQLRSSGRQGSASADELIAYWAKRGRARVLMASARASARSVQSDWRAYCRAYDAGLLDDAQPVRERPTACKRVRRAVSTPAPS